MGVNVVPLVVIAMVPIITGSFGQRANIGKRSSNAANAFTNDDYPDYPAKYDDYPVVTSKRAALLFDQLMVALQKVVDQGKGSVDNRFAANPEPVPVIQKDHSMDLQRRGQGKSQVYWRCYFNAVTCFRRK